MAETKQSQGLRGCCGGVGAQDAALAAEKGARLDPSSDVPGRGSSGEASEPGGFFQGHDFSGIPLRLLGFGVLMGWHFLLLFFPLPLIAAEDQVTALLYRQIALNGSLAAFFVLFGALFDSAIMRGAHRKDVLVVVGAALAVLGCGGIMLAQGPTDTVLLIVSMIVVGAGEALLIVVWLHFYCSASIASPGRYLASSMVIGALVCYFTRHLTDDLSLTVFATLPVVSSVMLLLAVHTTPHELEGRGESVGVPDWDSARWPVITSTTQLAVFSFAFGLLQGCVAPDVSLFAVGDSAAMLGVGLAGCGVVVLYLLSPARPNLSLLHRMALLLFTGGILLVPGVVGAGMSLAAVVVMTGFILLDTLILIFMIDLVRTFDLRPGMVVGLNRGLEYASFAVGIVAGYALWSAFRHVGSFPFALTSATVFVCLAVALVMLEEKDVWVARFHDLVISPEATSELAGRSDGGPGARPQEGRFRRACSRVCEQHGLSPRESEVFLLLAKGRNAEFIQNALFISGHTAKTHISNIYKKLEVHSAQEVLDMIEELKNEEAGEKPT